MIKLHSLMAFFFGAAAIGVGASYSKLYLFHFALAFIILLYINGNLQSLQIKFPMRFYRMIPMMFLWFLITIIWSWDREATLAYCIYIATGGSIVFFSIRYASNLPRLGVVYRAISVVVCAEILIALLEVTGFFRYPISPYSSLSSLFGKVGGVDWFLEDDILADMLRTPTGFSWNPNQLGAKIVIILPFILLLNSKFFRAIGITSSLTIIVLSGSRGSVIAAIIVLLAYAALYIKKDLKVLLIFITAVTFSIFIGWNYFVADTYYALAAYISPDDLDLEKLDSIGVRQMLIKNAIDALWNTYGLGVGGGADIAMQLMYDNTYWGGRSDEHTLSMHNFWIELLVNGGVVFFLIFVVWYFRIIHLLYIISQSTTDKRLAYYSSASCISLIGFSLAAISASSVIYFLPMWLLFGFSIATINIHYGLRSVTS